MSIDLGIDSVRAISITPLLPKIAGVLGDLLGLSSVPSLAVERLEGGLRVPVITDVVGTDSAPLLLVSVSGEPESISIVGGSDSLAVSMSGLRSSLLYALGAATAITLARELGSGIWDDRRCSGDEEHTSPETLFARLRVAGRHENYREAAERIRWGLAGRLDSRHGS